MGVGELSHYKSVQNKACATAHPRGALQHETMWHDWQCATKTCEQFGKAKPAEGALEVYVVGAIPNTVVGHGVSCPPSHTQKISQKVRASTEQNIWGACRICPVKQSEWSVDQCLK